MNYRKNIDDMRAVMVTEDDGMFLAGICNNGYQWSTVTTYSTEMLVELRDALTIFLNSKEKTNEPN